MRPNGAIVRMLWRQDFASGPLLLTSVAIEPNTALTFLEPRVHGRD